jgi:uncharacterized membrane protein
VGGISVTLPLFLEVPVPSQKTEQSCICVLSVSILPVSTIFLLNFGTVPTVWYFFVVHFNIKDISSQYQCVFYVFVFFS